MPRGTCRPSKACPRRRPERGRIDRCGTTERCESARHGRDGGLLRPARPPERGSAAGLRAAWRSTSREAHEEAWTAVRAVGASRWLEQGDRPRCAIEPSPGPRAARTPFRTESATTSPGSRSRTMPGEAIVDAALAMALGSRLDGASRKILIRSLGCASRRPSASGLRPPGAPPAANAPRPAARGARHPGTATRLHASARFPWADVGWPRGRPSR